MYKAYGRKSVDDDILTNPESITSGAYLRQSKGGENEDNYFSSQSFPSFWAEWAKGPGTSHQKRLPNQIRNHHRWASPFSPFVNR